jgi:hypothetical protein
MKKNVFRLLCLVLLAALLSGCGGKTDGNITFTGVVEEIYDGAILVSTADEAAGFDKARVDCADVKTDFGLEVGQTLIITILPEIAESYPVQVKAVSLEPVREYEAADPKNVSLTIEKGSVSPTGLTLVITDRNDEPFTYGEWFKLQRKEGGDWADVPVTAEGDYGFNDIGLIPDSSGVLTLETDWEWLYGALAPGEYRILKSVWTTDGTQYLSADFEIS